MKRKNIWIVSLLALGLALAAAALFWLLPAQERQQAQQRRRLAGAGRGHQVQQKRSVLLELHAKACGLTVVVGEDALFHLDDLIGFCHIASISFKLISLPCLSHVFSLPQCGQVRPNCTVG